MERYQRRNPPGRIRPTGARDPQLGLPLAALAVLSLGGLVACGGSEDGGPTGPPPPPPPPPEPSVTCAESPPETSDGPWQEQASGVEGAISRVQFLDATAGRAVQRNRQGHPLTLLRTSDGGSTWCAVEITADRSTDMGHYLAFLDRDTGFTGGEACTLMSTDDRGASWTRRSICSSSRWLLSIEPIDSDRIWVGGGGGLLFRSRNGGDSWARVTVAGLDQPVSGIAFASQDVGLLVGSGAGDVFRTADGGESWERHASPGGELLNDVALANATTAVAVGEAGTIVRTADGGETWSALDSGVSHQLSDVDFGSDGFGVAVGDRGTILVSTDAGASWTPEESPAQTVLAGVSVLDADHAWIVGNGGTILVRAKE